MTRVVLTALLAFCLVSAAWTQERTWEFSRDTVDADNNSRVSDTVRVMNVGVDTLSFDSVHLELLRPTAQNFQVVFDPVPRVPQTQPYFASYDSGTVTYSWAGSTSDPRTIAIRPQDTASFSGFQVGRHPLIVSKRAAIEPGDSVIVRLIFIASGGRGRDSLVVSGVEPFPLGVKPVIPNRVERPGRARWFDFLGRRVDDAPSLKGFPSTPVLTP